MPRRGKRTNNWLRSLQDLSSEERKSVIQKKVLSYAAELGADELNGSTPWVDGGLDSLSIVELRNMLAKLFDKAISLSTTVLYDYPTADALVAFIEEKSIQ